MNDQRRGLPSVDALLRDPGISSLQQVAPRNAVVGAVREAVERARRSRAGPPGDWAALVAELLARQLAPSLAPVLNATGTILHTNLGRAPLAQQAIDAMVSVARGYSTLEFDLHAGVRGSRADHCRQALASLAGAEDALVVNNAAGALVLALSTTARHREVILSRGELIEIGGSFRIPEILEQGGARLVEVGTTNRTHLEDYQRAIGPNTAAILTVHRSNFAQTGFVATPAPAELAALAHAHGIPYLHDVGSGLLLDLAPWGLEGEPGVQAAIAAGADVVMFSGDKLLGGPQAGCLVGTAAWLGPCRTHPLARALRADKMTLAAMEATLALYRDLDVARTEIPALRMLTESLEQVTGRARALAATLPRAWNPHLAAGESTAGGGAFPGSRIPTMLVLLEPGPLGAHGLALRLRLGNPPIVARIAGERVALDPRTLPVGFPGTPPPAWPLD